MSFVLKKKSFLKTPVAGAIIAIFCSVNVYAEQTDIKSEAKKIEKITVVGATTNSEITSKELDNFQANDLEDIFRRTPSVTVGGSLGIAQKVFVRGMEDSMVNITVDGAPQTSTLFHHIGRVAIEPELLQSIEVQAGAGEATSGIGAVGGAIRFKTKSANNLLSKDEKFGGIVKGNYFTNDGHKESISLYGKIADKVGVLASYVNVDRNNMDDGNGTEIPGSASEQTLGFVKLNAELTENQELVVSYENRKEEGRFGKQTNWASLADAPLFESWGERETVVLNHTWYRNNFLNLETTIYNTESSFKRELYTWDASIKTTGFDLRNTSDIGDHSVIYGVEHKVDKVNSQSYEDFGGIFDEEGKVTGLYLQDHWQVTDSLLLSFGGRYDAYELDHHGIEANWIKVDGTWVVETDSNGDPVTSSSDFSTNKQDGFSGNIGFEYSFTQALKLSAGYAQALRGRQVADAFTVGELTPNPDLSPENVDNTELGLVFNDGTWLFETSVYLSVINDVVFDKFKGREGVFYENIGDLETKGVELVAGYQGNDFDIIVSYNHNNVELNNATFVWPDANDASGYSPVTLDGVDIASYEYGGLGNAVGDSLNVNVNYEVNEQIQLGLNYNHVISLNDIEVFHRSIELGWATELETVDKPGYDLVDVYVAYTPTANLKLNLSIQNLFDELYRSHGSVADYGHIPGYESVVGINESGQDVRLSVAYQF